MELNGKRILMFAPVGTTVHYGVGIEKEIVSRGATLYRYPERPKETTFWKIVIRLFRNTVPGIFRNYIKGIIKKHKGEHFDYLLVCRGEAFTPNILSMFKETFPGIKIIFFIWDILASHDVSDNIPYCDKAFSFDPEDCSNHKGLVFRPTFFVEDYRTVASNTPKSDVVFIGTLHSNRYKTIKRLESWFESQGIRFYEYLYIPSRLIYAMEWVKKFPYISIKKVHFSPITLNKTIKILGETRAILDLNFTNQKSLSTRAYEAMASQKKYITTNPEIRKYDFYNPRNIAIIDMEHPSIDTSFWDNPFEPVDEKILYRYSISGLVDDLFGWE
jgi:hypothetical protein